MMQRSLALALLTAAFWPRRAVAASPVSITLTPVRLPLLRGTDDPYDDVLDSSCLALVPFANRIGGGCYHCGGRDVRLARKQPGDASPLHGQSWRAARSLESLQTDRAARIRQPEPADALYFQVYSPSGAAFSPWSRCTAPMTR